MKLIWVLFIAVVTINVTQAESLIDKVLENNIIESDVPKASKPTSYAITRRRNISLFLNKPHRENNFVVNLNPTVKSVRQTELEKYRKPFMKKLLIKDINNKNNVKVTEELTMRRSFMQRKNFTVRPHDVHPKTTNNWKRNKSIFNLEKSKRETNITIGKIQPGSEDKDSEKETQNFPVVNLNPTVKTVRQTELEIYRKPFMNKLLIKDINNKDNIKATLVVTTRRSMMQRKNFTHDVYAKTANKNYNSNRNNSVFNLEKSKRETNITIGKVRSGSEEKDSEKETQNFPVLNLNPTVKTVTQTELEKYRKPFMKKLLIKDINNKDNIKATSVVTTRRSLMQRKNFTAKPHDVYAKTNNKKYNWNRNNSVFNLEKSKKEMNITIGKAQAGSEEKGSLNETQNLNRDDESINDYDFVDFEKQHISNRKHTHIHFGLRKPKTLLLFPKRNVLNYLTENTLKLGSENETSSNIENDQNSNDTILEDKENITIIPEKNMKSDSKDQLEEVKEPKENISDQEEKDREEFIYVKEVNQNVVSNDNHDVSGNGLKTIGQRFRFYSFMKNKL